MIIDLNIQRGKKMTNYFIATFSLLMGYN